MLMEQLKKELNATETKISLLIESLEEIYLVFNFYFLHVVSLNGFCSVPSLTMRVNNAHDTAQSVENLRLPKA